jgi:cbb3-type cytochrome oxidase cytochrome c subunit
VGPALDGLSRRRTREWIEKQVRQPQSHFPETMMPAYDLPAREMELLVTYLLSVPYIKPFSVAQLDTSVSERRESTFLLEFLNAN